MSNTWGETIRVTLFGESHGTGIGAVIDGLPPGIAIDWERVKKEMARRAPGSSPLATPRKEKDSFTVLSGYFNGYTTGTPLAMEIRNENQHSRDYGELKSKMRPGHADYTGYVKYHGYNDYRGGGHFSGRITAPLTFAGAIARQVLEKEGIYAGAHALDVHGISDRPFNPMGEDRQVLESLDSMRLPVLDREAGQAMEAQILIAQKAGDSTGGIVECILCGLPAGLGDPFFDSLESCMAHMMFSIPAVKGLEFGDGFRFSRLYGSQANDAMHYHDGRVESLSNHNGGILGGITSGAPVLFRTVVKPTASIDKRQHTVDIEKKEDTLLSVGGRHDPCIVPRAIPVIENAAALVVLDRLLTDRRPSYGQ